MYFCVDVPNGSSFFSCNLIYMKHLLSFTALELKNLIFKPGTLLNAIKVEGECTNNEVLNQFSFGLFTILKY